MRMAKPKKILKIILGIIIGIVFSQISFNRNTFCRTHIVSKSPLMRSIIEDEHDFDGNEIVKEPKLLFVGVMTAEKYVNTRAKAIYETWGKNVPGKIQFFSSENSTSENIPLVALSGIDDIYPPQKKAFTMLKYMHDNYIDQYEWFLRADDDVYVRNDRLEQLLRSINSNKPYFIGQAGQGTKAEVGHLSLDPGENFCMGGPGMIMSRETLKRVAPYLEDCIQNLYTAHEDVEVGRCVKRYADVSCTWSYEMRVIFHHSKNGATAFSGSLKHSEIHRAITLHPIKKPSNLYRVHEYIQGLKIQNLLDQSLHCHRAITNSMAQLGYRVTALESVTLAQDVPLYVVDKGTKGYLGDTSLLGTPISITRYQPRNVSNILEWELISKTLYSHRDLNPRKRIGSSLKEGLNDIIREIMELINSLSKQRGRVIDFKELLYGYWRLNPIHGVDFILDLLLVYKKYRGHKMTVEVRRHAYVQQTFTGIFIREITNTDLNSTAQNKSTNMLNGFLDTLNNNIKLLPFLHQSNHSEAMINFLLPLSGRYETFVRFITMYEKVCIENWGRTRLYVILYSSQESPGDYNATLSMIEKVNSNIRTSYFSSYKYHNFIKVIHGKTTEKFSRASALQKAVNLLNDDDLMLFIDVDVIFDQKFLNRVRQNTVKEKSVYFPILYSLYNPKLLDVNLDSYNKIGYDYFTENQTDSNRGFWRQFGFGIVSIYKFDYVKFGGYNLSIKGWGTEDVTFFENVVNKHTHKIFRCVDPGLIHVFHEVKCTSEQLDAEQKYMCLGTKAGTIGSMETLQKLFEKYRKLFR